MAKSNLIPNTERSPEELREMGRKGGIKSGESRRRKRDMLRMVKLWGEVFEAEATKEARAKREEVLKEIAGRYGMKW
ncbi:MAG: hypothetical protein ACLVJ4_08470 [Mediterraneibacter sp.]